MNTAQLDTALAGETVVPGSSDWDSARTAWNLAVDQRPAAVVFAESAADVMFDAEHARCCVPTATGRARPRRP